MPAAATHLTPGHATKSYYDVITWSVAMETICGSISKNRNTILIALIYFLDPI